MVGDRGDIGGREPANQPLPTGSAAHQGVMPDTGRRSRPRSTPRNYTNAACRTRSLRKL